MPWLLYPQHITPVSTQQRAGLDPEPAWKAFQTKKNHLLYQAFEPRTAQARSYAIPAAVRCAYMRMSVVLTTRIFIGEATPFFVPYLTMLSTIRILNLTAR
jgi:hypothetical protein